MSVVSLVVRLVDKVSTVAPKIVGSMKTIETATNKVGQAGSRLNNLTARFAGVAAGVAGLSAAAASFGRNLQGTVRDSAEFEDMLQGIAQTGEMTAGQLTSLRGTILGLAPLLGRLPAQVGKVANDLVAAGISPDRVERMLEPIGRTAVATRSQIDDIGKTALGLFQNLDVAPDKLESTFDKVWLASKRGNFELKDMAQHFQKIASSAQRVGMRGVGAAVELAAAAQIVREGAGTPGQAATNLDNLLAKLQSPETVKKYQKVGIDLKKEFADGMAKGQSPLETLVIQTRKALADNKGLTVGDLFQDMQAQSALGKLVEKFENFIKIRDEAMKATGTIEADFKAMSETTLAAMKRMDAAIDVRKKSWAKMLDPIEQFRAGIFERLNLWAAGLTERFPRLSTGIGTFAVACADLLTILGSLGTTLLGLASTLFIGRMLGLGKMLLTIARLATFPVRFLAGFGISFVSQFARAIAPLGPAILAGLVALGPFVLRGLGYLARLLTGPVGWALIGADLAWTFREPLMRAMQGLWDWLKQSWSQLGEFLGSIDVSGFVDRLSNSISEQFGNAANWATEAGRNIMNKLLDGLKSAAQAVIGWVTGFAGRLKSLFSFNASPTITPQGGGATVQPQSAPNNLTPAPAMKQASMSFTNTFHINGADNAESVAQRIVTALDRQRQAGLYDGALA